MTLPFTMPDWLPWWATFAVLVVAGLYGLAFLLMPFSVFGVRGRLDAVEARLDEIQGEIRSLSLRLPEPGGRYDPELLVRPPIPPARPAAAPPSTGVRDRERRQMPGMQHGIDYPPPPFDRPMPIRRRPEATRGPRAEPSFDQS